MVFGGRFFASALVSTIILAACLFMREIEVVQFPGSSSKTAFGKKSRYSIDRADYGPDVFIRPGVLLPNEGRREDSAPALGNDVGTRSVHNGAHQEERRSWLKDRAEQLRIGAGGDSDADRGGSSGSGREQSDRKSREEDRERQVQEQAANTTSGVAVGEGAADSVGRTSAAVSLNERVLRLEKGEKLWGATYVPPIAPEWKRDLISKWTAPNEGEASGYRGGAPRVLMVVTSFDRGDRLGSKIRDMVDKLDYVLMIMDEVREACEAGFWPELHLISAWDPEPEEALFRDRLFCERTEQSVPYTFEQHDPKIAEVLSIKHRIYMKTRVEDHDVFIQVEDDMILTLNHILLFLEESHNLAFRRGVDDKPPAFPSFDLIPGFIRVEPEIPSGGNAKSKTGVEASGVGGEWFEWEISLSRFRGVKVAGLGPYLTLEKSKVLPYQGNNQGLWMATQGQLKSLQKNCKYLNYDEGSNMRFVERLSGSLEMYSSPCKVTKVFPAARFEDFLVHHRTNNKNGKRGESIPAVSVSMLRLWASQVVRDSVVLREIGGSQPLRPG